MRRLFLLAAPCIFLVACSSSTSSSATADTLSVYLTPGFATIPGNGTSTFVVASASRSAASTAAITFAATGLPTGVTATITQPGTGSFGTVFLASTVASTPGTYPITITATDGVATSTAMLSTTVLPVDAITVAAAAAVVVRQDATPLAVPLAFTHSLGSNGPVTVTAGGLPTGLNAAFTQPGATLAGAVTFTTSSTPAAAGTYTITLSATDATVTGTTTIAVTIAPVLTVANATDTTIGLAGHLQQFMSTGFQPSTYDNGFFTSFPSTTSLAALNAEHIRLQPVVGALPQLANSTPQAATDWNFAPLDLTVQPVLTVGDQSPIFQIAKAPSFLDDASGHFIYNAANLAVLTTYAQNIVRYYNTGGFTWGGKHFQQAGSQHITWWAIFNEPNLNNITPAQYVTMYNTLVPAMLAVDPTLKFVALELSDYAGQTAAYLPTLVQPAASGGLNAPVNAIATHFYGTCVQATTDASLFAGISAFTTDVAYFRTELAKRTDLAGVPVWVTENNVDSDYQMTNGYSDCTPTQLYVLDARGTSTFFTAYRPLLFSRLGKAGNESLYHFLYEGTAAYGEVLSSNNSKTLAYWVDYWLQRLFPWDGVTPGALLYKTTDTESTATVDILATRNADTSVSLMVTNFATVAATDDNGAGGARTVLVNLAALGTFRTGTEVDLNAATPLIAGPTSTSITPATSLTLSFSGYGAKLFTLQP